MNLGNHLLKVAMLSSISIASLSVGSVAFAQDNTPQASDEADENVIIVTATKREQTLQEIPVAVTVTSAETIERAQVRDLIDGVHSEKSSKEAQREELLRAQVVDMGEKDLAKEIKRLEKSMLEHAKNLQFEQAAQVRDQLSRLREQVLGASGKDTLARNDVKSTTA